MSLGLDDPIVAVATPPGAACRAVVRISGANVTSIVDRILDVCVPKKGPPVRITGHVVIESLGTPLPVNLLVWPGRRSYTGQSMAELHVIGAPPLLELLLTALIDMGARPAERGEFTMRAFLNGRIDLLQAEAVSGVIDAADHDELLSALMQLGGGITQQLREIRSTIIAILGDLEAGLDFVEDDIEFISKTELLTRLNDARSILKRLRNDARQRLPSDCRPRAVLAGLPNAGKSTLFNTLAQAELAIVSTIAGTTRDYLSCPITIGNTAIELVDTAGWDYPTDNIMIAAEELRQQQLNTADVVVWCSAADLTREERDTDRKLGNLAAAMACRFVSVVTCIDRVQSDNQSEKRLRVSAVTGSGLDELRLQITDRLTDHQRSRGELLATTSLRCRNSIQQALSSIDCALDSAVQDLGDEITAISLRESLQELRSILGETWTDEILDHIFSSFCIGK